MSHTEQQLGSKCLVGVLLGDPSDHSDHPTLMKVRGKEDWVGEVLHTCTTITKLWKDHCRIFDLKFLLEKAMVCREGLATQFGYSSKHLRPLVSYTPRSRRSKFHTLMANTCL